MSSSSSQEAAVQLNLTGKEAIYAINQMALSVHPIFKETFEKILMDPQQQILHIYAIDYFVSVKDILSKSDIFNLLYKRFISEDFKNSHDAKLVMALMKIDPEQMISTLHQHSLMRQVDIINTFLELQLYLDYCLRHQLRTEISKYPVEKQAEYFGNIIDYIASRIEN